MSEFPRTYGRFLGWEIGDSLMGALHAIQLDFSLKTNLGLYEVKKALDQARWCFCEAVD